MPGFVGLVVVSEEYWDPPQSAVIGSKQGMAAEEERQRLEQPQDGASHHVHPAIA
jgi:hypothetical protein